MKCNQKEGVSLKETEKSNYDQVIENWRLKFLEMDQEKLIRKFHLEADEEALYIVYFSRKLRIDRKNGEITDHGVRPGFDTVMNIYNTFYYASEHPVASGGTPLPQGDVGYVLPVFPFLNIAVLFWDKDEEFDAQANMLFDSEITEFMHEENVVCVAADAVYYLTLAAGLPGGKIYAE